MKRTYRDALSASLEMLNQDHREKLQEKIDKVQALVDGKVDSLQSTRMILLT